MKNNNEIKQGFYLHFTNDMKAECFMDFFYELFLYGNAYVVGGYFRDFILNKDSRDVDIITEISTDLILNLIKKFNVNYTINRHGGIKVELKTIEIDIWNIENNWAFKNNLVKLNENDKLNSIAKGCFYDFDSPVINLFSFNFNTRYFNDCMNNCELDILQKKTIYKKLNPSIEANILRAIHLNKMYNFTFSKNTIEYLSSKIGYLEDKHSDSLDRLLKVKKSYNKYQHITEIDILNLFFKIMEQQNDNQLKLDL